jgi:putative transposase
MRSQGHAVESICRVRREQGCQIAARTYRAQRSGRRGLSSRTVTDAQTAEAIRQVAWRTDGDGRRRLAPEGLYGRRKMLAHLRRAGLEVTAGAVDRGMRLLGLSGVVRGKPHRTTIADQGADRAPDLLNRDFTAAAPNLKWVTDFTYVRSRSGFVYVAFILASMPSGSSPGTPSARKLLTWCRFRCGWRSGNETGRATPPTTVNSSITATPGLNILR